MREAVSMENTPVPTSEPTRRTDITIIDILILSPLVAVPLFLLAAVLYELLH